MELPTQEGEMPLPINSAYGGGHGHMIHHDHAAAPQILPTNGLMSSTLVDYHDQEHHAPKLPYKKVVKYRECLKNHAAAMGGNATDGCGEFMPSGEEGTLEALTCSACNCHRNFHRKEFEGEASSCVCYPNPHHHHPLNRVGRKVIVGQHHLLHHQHHHQKSILGHESFGYHAGTLIPSRAAAAAAVAAQPHQMIMSYNIGGGSLIPSESDEQEDVGGVLIARPPHPHQLVKKRFRTKFTPEQKEKMLQFAENVGWKIQKQEESVVQQFCQEVGVKRRVLKVWMHNNKHNLAKNKDHNSINIVENQFREEGSLQQN